MKRRKYLEMMDYSERGFLHVNRSASTTTVQRRSKLAGEALFPTAADAVVFTKVAGQVLPVVAGWAALVMPRRRG